MNRLSKQICEASGKIRSCFGGRRKTKGRSQRKENKNKIEKANRKKEEKKSIVKKWQIKRVEYMRFSTILQFHCWFGRQNQDYKNWT